MVLVLLIVVFTVAFAVIAQILIDRLVPQADLESSQHRIGELFIQPASGLYGVLLAFILAGALSSYQDLRRGIAIEANAIIDLVRLSDSFPSPTSSEIRAAALEYARSVVVDEWPRLAEGSGSSRTSTALANLWHPISTFSPATAGDTNLHALALDLVRMIGTQRRLRILAASRTIPVLIWVVLGFGGAITIVLSTFSSPPRNRLRHTFVAALAATIALSLATLHVLGQPFGSSFPLIAPEQLSSIREWLTTQP